MKRFLAIVLAMLVILSMTSCSTVTSSSDESNVIICTGEFTVKKLEVWDDAGTYRYIMSIKNDNIALLFRVTATEFLKYEIGDMVSAEVKDGDLAGYYVRLGGDGEWFAVLESIGLED